jgi:SNF2 family DNA or RNA helicase
VASTVAFAEMYWVPALHVQAEDRVHRIGQKEPSFSYYLVGKGTVEERLCKVLQARHKDVTGVLDGRDAEGMNVWDLLTEIVR